MSTPKLSVVKEEVELDLTNKELEEQVIALLEDNRRLRHDINNRRHAYGLTMEIVKRQRSKITDLEATIKMIELCNEAFTPTVSTQPKLKIA